MILCVAANPSIDRVLEVDSLAFGAIHRPRRVTVVAGGKGLNVARAAVQIGGRVRAAVLLGGHAGRWIADELAASGIDPLCAWFTGETRTCVSIAADTSAGLTEFYEKGPQVTEREWDDFQRLVASAASGANLMTLSGSLPPSAPASGWANVIRAGHVAGCTVLLDSSGEPLRQGLAAGPSVVKVNASEAQAATGWEVVDLPSAARAADALRQLGAGAAIVTAGAAGAAVVDDSGAYACTAGPFGRFPVGSGDAFLAGLAVALDRGEPLPQAAGLASAAAAANAAVAGPGLLDQAVLQAAAAAIRVEPLNVA